MSNLDEPKRVNPYAVTQAIDEDAIAFPHSRYESITRIRVSFGLTVVLYVGCIISAILACIDIESIIGSGPGMTGIAVAALVATNRTPLSRFRYQAIATIGFCLICWTIIWGFGLSPGRAQWPIGSLVVAFALLMNTQWAGWYSERRRFQSREDSSP